MRKKIINYLILAIGIGLIISLSRDIWRLLKVGDRIKEAQSKVEEQEERNRELRAQKEYYLSEEFVEKEARNKLNLSKEREKVVILPPNVRELVGQAEPQKPPMVPNWRRWWNFFF